MKGPGLRIDLDVRRIWRCPRCGRVARTSGGVTAQRCRCVDNGTWMQLQQPVKREPFRPPPRAPEDREPDEAEEPEQLADEPAETAAVSEGASGASMEVVVVEASTELIATVEEVATPEAAPPTPVVDAVLPEADMREAEAPAPVDSSTVIVVPEPRPESADDGFGAGVDEPPSEGSPDDSSTRRV